MIWYTQVLQNTYCVMQIHWNKIPVESSSLVWKSFCAQEENFKNFRLLLAKLAWVQQWRPDIAYNVAILKQAANKQIFIWLLKLSNTVSKILEYIQESRPVELW